MIEIITADESHVSDIGKLWLEFIRFHQDIDPIYAQAENAVSGFKEEQLRRLMKTEEGLVLVALEKGQVVGYSLSEIREPPKGGKRAKYGYIHQMAITASYRRKGVGEKMFDEIIRWFYSKDVDRVELDITTKNQVASSFWKKQGFTEHMSKLYREI